MIKRVFLAMYLVSGLLGEAIPVSMQSTLAGEQEPYFGDVLCQPGVYQNISADCLVLGPSAFLTDLARLGIVYPPRPLPAYHPGPEYDQVPVKFAKINVEPTEPVAIYSSLEDAANGNNPLRYLGGGILRFVSYKNQVDIGGGHYVQLQTGEWMRASPAALSSFQGLVFTQLPKNSFGWIVERTHPHSAPDYQSAELEKVLERETVVPIYNIQRNAQGDWYLTGINEWVERRYIRQFVINLTPPEGVDNNRWIEINLYEQTLGVYENGRLLFATLIASGVAPYYTRPGLFKIEKKKPQETMQGAFEADKSDAYYLEDVPWTMYFDQARALHGAYWRTMFGYPQSHGCVNLSLGDAHWLYDWAKEGDWVYVWDPSGATPTDPELYTQGGA